MCALKQSVTALTGACVVMAGAVSAKPYSRAQPQPHVSTSVCTKMPLGVCPTSVMIPNVVYYAPPMYLCAENHVNEWTTMWCEDDDQNPGSFTTRYCCGIGCSNMPQLVRTCNVHGYTYVVGYAYDVFLGDTPAKLWCTSENEHVTCTEDDCGSTPELTPPGLYLYETATSGSPAPLVLTDSNDSQQAAADSAVTESGVTDNVDSSAAGDDTTEAQEQAAGETATGPFVKHPSLPELLQKLNKPQVGSTGGSGSVSAGDSPAKPVRLSQAAPVHTDS